MPHTPLEYSIVDQANRRLWQRSAADFTAAQALAALDTLKARFPALKLFLFSVGIEANGRPRRRMLRNPNLRAAALPAGATHGAEERDAGAPETQALLEIELWHRRRLIRHLNYPGLSFETDPPARVARADFELAAEFLAPAHRPLGAVFRMSQNTAAHAWMPGEDHHKSTSIGDVMVIKGADGAPATNWMVMAMGFDQFETFD
jgi:hypothetical protein